MVSPLTIETVTAPAMPTVVPPPDSLPPPPSSELLPLESWPNEAEAAIARDRGAAEDAIIARASELALVIAERLLARLPPQLALSVGATNLWLAISGDTGHTNLVQGISSLTTTHWQTVLSFKLTNNPQSVSLPLPDGTTTFWRVVAE